MRLLKLWLPVVVWSALILSASNDTFSATQSRGWLHELFGREMPYAVNYILRKGGHILFYGILGALAYRADQRLPVAFGVVLLIASVDEFNQALTASRSGTLWDVLLDLTGGALAIYVMRRLRAIRSGR